MLSFELASIWFICMQDNEVKLLTFCKNKILSFVFLFSITWEH